MYNSIARRNQAQHVHFAAQAEIAGDGTRFAFDADVDAEHRGHRSGGDAEIDRDAGAGFEPHLQHLEAICGARMPHQPPPPRKTTAIVNGSSRVQKLKPIVTALPKNGTCTSAPSDRLVMLNMPSAMSGRSTLKPAVMPSAVTPMFGGSEKPSSGISCLMSSTNDSTPWNPMSSKTMSSSGFLIALDHERETR